MDHQVLKDMWSVIWKFCMCPYDKICENVLEVCFVKERPIRPTRSPLVVMVLHLNHTTHAPFCHFALLSNYFLYTALRGELEHLKIEMRLIGESFECVMGECDLEAINVPSIFSIIHSAAALVRI